MIEEFRRNRLTVFDGLPVFNVVFDDPEDLVPGDAPPDVEAWAWRVGSGGYQGPIVQDVFPQTIGLMRTMFDGAELPKAMGSIGPVMGLSAVSGPVLGGVLTHADLFGSSWRAVFLVNVPLSVAMGVASWIAGAYLMPRYGARLMSDFRSSCSGSWVLSWRCTRAVRVPIPRRCCLRSL